MSDSLLVTDNLAMARAIIADDHPLFRAALTQALRDTLSDPILEAANFQQLLELLAKPTN